MLKVKSIKKDDKWLSIIIKKPYFKNYIKFLEENNLIFKDECYSCFRRITPDGDIELQFILRNYDDIKPYLKYKN